jgi:hypothetical protein
MQIVKFESEPPLTAVCSKLVLDYGRRYSDEMMLHFLNTLKEIILSKESETIKLNTDKYNRFNEYA